MNILVVSGDLSAGDLCVRLSREGHKVRVYIHDESQRCHLRWIIHQTKNWRKNLKWAGKEGLILFDTTGFGKIQDKLRKDGYSVVGGSEVGDRCEDDRAYAQKILWACEVKIVPSKSFHSLDEAIHFVKKHPDEWVIKQNAHASKIFNYVGQLPNGDDVISTLQSYKKDRNKKDVSYIELQKRIKGIEIGVGRYFNGEDWVGPIEINLEHKDLCNGNLGPKTYEMGTLMWFDDDEKNKLFKETLGKLKEYLCHIHFHGDVDINCIVNEEGVFPLELTMRFGFPALQLQCALSQSPWGEFLRAVADGEQYDFTYKKGQYGIIVLVAVPPFPYAMSDRKSKSLGTDILFNGVLTDEEKNRIHFEEVSQHRDKTYYVSGNSGYVLHVSGTGKTVEAARKQAYDLIKKIIIPKMFYRTDIGLKFIEEDRTKLKKWGYV